MMCGDNNTVSTHKNIQFMQYCFIYNVIKLSFTVLIP